MAEEGSKVPFEGVAVLSALRPPEGAVRNKKRKGRGVGSGTGKTSGKGQKGQKARHPGGLSRLGFEGGQSPLQRRLPKIGFWNPFRVDYDVVNLRDLARFDAGSKVTLEALQKARLVRSKAKVKILGAGSLDRALHVEAHAFSKSAREAIVAAGGSVQEQAVAAKKQA